MAATYDNSVTVHGFGNTTLTTGTFTISASANRAAALHLGTYGAVTSVTGSCGGVSGALVTNAYATIATGGTKEARTFGVTAPASGSQTATMAWTTSVACALSAVTAIGVNQTTSLNNGNNATASSTSCSVSITSNSGDLTTTGMIETAADSAGTSNQTKKTTDFLCADVGPGTGTTTHTWSHSSTAFAVAGANFVAAGGATLLVRDIIGGGRIPCPR